MKKNKGFSKSRVRMTGVSLIEVAVSVLILSIGALGLAGVQISAKRAGHEALQRTVAASLATELIERMRANPSVLDDYDTSATEGVGLAMRKLPAKPGNECSTKVSACTSTGLAVWDLWEWERALNGGTAIRAGVAAGGLINPVGCVTVVGRQVTVVIAWRGSNNLTDPNAGSGCGSGKYEISPLDANRQLLQITSYISEV